MQSRLFQELTGDTINSLTQKHFQKDAQSFSLIKGGMFNTTYHVTLTDGRPLILRAGPADPSLLHIYERRAMQAEEAVYPLMEKAGIPCPKILALDTSKTLLGRDYMFEEVLDGIPISQEKLTQEEKSALLEECGRLTRMMHDRIQLPSFGRAAMVSDGVSYQSWGEFFARDVLDWAQKARECGYFSNEEILAAEAVFEKYRDVLDEVKQPRLVHIDLWENNVLVAKVNGQWKVTGIIDADRAIYGDPWMEFTYDWIFSDDFRKGYGMDRPEDEHSVLRRTLYDLYYNLYDSYFFSQEYPDPETCESKKRRALEIIARLG